jgi:hypothetical protein
MSQARHLAPSRLQFLNIQLRLLIKRSLAALERSRVARPMTGSFSPMSEFGPYSISPA